MGREINLDRLTVFVAVAECGGFTAAARRLGSTKKLVSHHISRLETELGGPLFHRTTRQVRLTSGGSELLRVCQPALGELTNAFRHFSNGTSRPRGRLRITATPEHAASELGVILAEFSQAHPELQIELHTSVEQQDLIQGEFDLAIRVGWLRDSALRATRVGRFEQYIVASPAYLASAGQPVCPQELLGLRWIELTLLSDPLRWQLARSDGQQASLQLQAAIRANSPPAALGLVLGGAGVTALPDFIVRPDLERGRLVRLLCDWALPEGGYYLVFPGKGPPTAAVRVFIDFYRARRLKPARNGAATRLHEH